MTPQAKATTAGITTDGLVLDWNTSDSADRSIASGVVPTYTASGPGYYELNGSTQYIFPNAATTVGNISGTRYLSVFMWVYPKGSGQLLTQQDGTSLNCCYHTAIMEYTATDQLHVGLWNGSDQTSINLSAQIPTPKNNWYLVGLVYDGAKINGYINGTFAGSTSNFTYSPPGTAYYGIGANDVTNIVVPESKGNMRVGGLYIYNKGLTGAEAQSNFNATVSRFGPTVGNPSNASTFTNRTATFSSTACTNTSSGSASCNYGWQLSTDGGSTWNFISGATSNTYTTPVLTSSYNGYKYRLYAWDPGTGVTTANDLYTISSVATLTVTTLPGTETDTAVNTSGTQFFYAPAADSILPGVQSTVTMEAWVNPSATCDGSYFCSILASNYSFILDVYQGKVAYIIGSGTAWCDGGSVTYVANGLVPSGSWTHVAMVRSSANVKIYVNGGLVSNVTSSCVPTTLTAPSSQQFGVGYRQSHDQYFYGSIDEVRIWTTDRSSSIASDMHSNETSTSGLINYWNFNEGTGGTAYNRVPAASSSSDLISYGSTKDSASFWDADSISLASTSGAYSIRTFKRSYITAGGGWKVPTNVSKVTALVIAGGGGGGSRVGGGGGAGGYSFSPVLTLTPNQFEAITIGQGGLGAQRPTINEYQGRDGQNTSLGSRVTVIGGGGGGGYNTSSNTDHAGRSGGSGGGAAPHLSTAGTWPAGVGTGTDGQGFNGGSGFSGTAGYYPAGGGGGAGGLGGTATSNSVSGAGGSGILDPISGSNLCFASGGGGGVGNLFSGSTGGAAGSCSGGVTTASAGTKGQAIPSNATANSGSGGGGAGYISGNSNDVAGGSGGSGIIIIRWITASAPIFTGPVSDTLTAGMVETFTVSGSPISPLTRNYRWQVSTDTGTTWVNASTGSGFTSANYTTSTLETTTSGTRYRYRVVVTDSDTAGLFIVETSTAIVFLTINPRITITGSSVSLTQKYGETQTVTYTIANGTGTRTTAASPNNRTGITWSSVSGSAATLAIGAGLSVGTYYETLTVTDSVTATTSQMVSISISKADTITVTATPSTTTYNASSIIPAYVVSGLKNGETATATNNFLGINGTTYATTTTPPTNAGNYRFTPSDIVLSVGASLNNYQNVTYESATVTINKAFQAKLSIGQYDAFPGISSYPINVYGGTGLGSVTRTLVETGTANCALSGTLILTAANVGTCTVRAVKDGGVNYFNETSTATIYWINFINRYTPSGPTTPTDLGLSGSTGFERRSYETFTVLSFANGSGSAVTSAAKGSVMRIIGTGFNSSDDTTEVIIGFFSIPKSSLTFNTTNPLANFVEFTLPNSSDLDAGANDVAMKSRKGWAFAPSLLNVTG
jgi:hypothetical protein